MPHFTSSAYLATASKSDVSNIDNLPLYNSCDFLASPALRVAVESMSPTDRAPALKLLTIALETSSLLN